MFPKDNPRPPIPLPNATGARTLASARDPVDFIGSITCCHVALFVLSFCILAIAASISISTWIIYSEIHRLNTVLIPNIENSTTVVNNILSGLEVAFPNNGWTTRSFSAMVTAVLPRTDAEMTRAAEDTAILFQSASVLLHQLSTSDVGPLIRSVGPLVAELRPADLRQLLLFATGEIHNGNAHHLLAALADTSPGSLRHLLHETAALNISTNAARVSAFLDSAPMAALLAHLDAAPAFLELGPVLKDLALQANASSLIEHASMSLALTNRLVGHGIY